MKRTIENKLVKLDLPGTKDAMEKLKNIQIEINNLDIKSLPFGPNYDTQSRGRAERSMFRFNMTLDASTTALSILVQKTLDFLKDADESFKAADGQL